MELKVCQSSRTMVLSKRESRFIKDDVPGDDDSIGGEVKAVVPFCDEQNSLGKCTGQT
jgi:hypothetical protein